MAQVGFKVGYDISKNVGMTMGHSPGLLDAAPLRSGPWWPDLFETKKLMQDANGELFIVHSVWRKDVSGSATVTVGALTIASEKYPYSMYGIAVKLLRSSAGIRPKT